MKRKTKIKFTDFECNLLINVYLLYHCRNKWSAWLWSCKATRLQRELEKHNLLRRKYQGKGKPAKLYVLTVPKISTEPP